MHGLSHPIQRGMSIEFPVQGISTTCLRVAMVVRSLAEITGKPVFTKCLLQVLNRWVDPMTSGGFLYEFWKAIRYAEHPVVKIPVR